MISIIMPYWRRYEVLKRNIEKYREFYGNIDTGMGKERERLLSAARIVSPAYGTRSSSAIVIGSSGRVRFAERAYGSDGAELDTARYEFDLS